MDEPHETAARTILTQMRRLPSREEQTRFLVKACSGDTELRARVEELLRAMEQSPDPDKPTVDAKVPIARDTTTDLGWSLAPSALAHAEAEQPGTTIGPYRLIQAIGEGGMGTVYLAEQVEPVRRRVALKVIKPGMDSRQVIERFKAERQALALMDHPHIAKVLDAGTTTLGRPFFVMELVDGIPITRYADDRRLTLRDRLALFVDVCLAVQHAHQKGIIHRDIKPSNVLVGEVDGKVVPKVIDFGVAKAIDQRLTDQTLLTQHGAIVGTPEYMSPEQAGVGSLDIDTRTDVYSLGVLLYELLTGGTPLRRESLRQAAFLEILRRIKEEEPPTPSSRLSTTHSGLPTVAANRGTEPARLKKLVRGELDWIVMKALEKDRSRRYDSAGALARDIRRHLADEPVEASPPSRVYRLQKFARRHKGPLAVAAGFAAVLVAATAVSLWQAWRATRAEARAQSELANFQEMDRFLTEDLLMQVTPGNNPVEDNLTLLQALDRAADKVAARFAGRPELEIRMREVIGRAYSGLGSQRKAYAQLEPASQLAARTLGESDPRTWEVRTSLALALYEDRRYEEALALALQAAEALTRLRGPDHKETIDARHLVARIHMHANQFDTARAELAQLLADCERTYGPDSYEALDIVRTLGVFHDLVGDFAASEAASRRVIAFAEKAYGPESTMTLTTRTNLANALIEQGRPDEALEWIEPTIAAKVRVYGPTHVMTQIARGARANALSDIGRAAEAAVIHRELVEHYARELGRDNRMTLVCLNNLAVCLIKQNRAAEAEPLARECYERARETLGPDDRITIQSQKTWSQCLAALRKPESTAVAEDVLARFRRVLGDHHPETHQARNALGLLYQETGHSDKAEQLLRPALSGTGPPAPHPHNAATTRWYLSLALTDLGLLDEAAAFAREALDMRRELFGREHVNTLMTLYNLVVLEHRLGRWAEAEPLIEDLYAIQKKFSPRTSMYLVVNTAQLARNKLELNKLDEAELLARDYQDMVKPLPEGHWMRAHADALLGATLCRKSKSDEGTPLLDQGVFGLEAARTQIQPWCALPPDNLSETLLAPSPTAPFPMKVDPRATPRDN